MTTCSFYVHDNLSRRESLMRETSSVIKALARQRGDFSADC